MGLENTIIDDLVVMGALVFGISAVFVFGVHTTKEAIDKYLSARREYKLDMNNSQQYLSPEFEPEEPSFMRYYKEAVKELISSKKSSSFY